MHAGTNERKHGCITSLFNTLELRAAVFAALYAEHKALIFPDGARSQAQKLARPCPMFANVRAHKMREICSLIILP